jgi:hypothetical protein
MALFSSFGCHRGSLDWLRRKTCRGLEYLAWETWRKAGLKERESNWTGLKSLKRSGEICRLEFRQMNSGKIRSRLEEEVDQKDRIRLEV